MHIIFLVELIESSGSARGLLAKWNQWEECGNFFQPLGKRKGFRLLRLPPTSKLSHPSDKTHLYSSYYLDLPILIICDPMIYTEQAWMRESKKILSIRNQLPFFPLETLHN